MIVMSANAAPSPESDKLAQFNKRIDAVEISAESAPLIGVTPTGSTPTSVSKPYIDAVLPSRWCACGDSCQWFG